MKFRIIKCSANETRKVSLFKSDNLIRTACNQSKSEGEVDMKVASGPLGVGQAKSVNLFAKLIDCATTFGHNSFVFDLPLQFENCSKIDPALNFKF